MTRLDALLARVRRAAAAAITLVAALAGCGQQTASTGEPAATPLPSGEYVVTAAAAGGAPRPFVPGTEVRFTFRGGMLAIEAGCNHLSGSYTVSGDRLRVGPVGGTEMGCDEERMEQDRWLAGLLAQDVGIGRDPLTLTAGDTVLTLTPRAEVHPDKPLAGTRWRLDGVIEGDAVRSIPAGPAVVLTLTGDAATVTGLCNGLGASVTVAGDQVTWTPGMRTLMACADDARNDLDSTVAAILTGRTAYSIEEDRLTLEHGDHGLVFVAAE